MFLNRTLRLLWLFLRFTIELYLIHRKKPRSRAAYLRRERVYKRQAIHFRNLATELGGLPIKVGQFLSTRVDVLPKAYTDELAKLQDEVAPVSFEAIQEILDSELGAKRSRLSQIEQKPLGSASLAQVHAAVLDGETPVALKVLRPNIQKQVQADLRALKIVILALSKYSSLKEQVDFITLYQEFLRTLSDELDLTVEGKHLAEFRANFKQDSKVYIPWYLEEMTTKRVLVMEKIQGVKVTDVAKIRGMGIDPREIANTLLDSYIKQVVDDGLFHADPHPGNLLVDSHGNLVYLDFGMMGRIKDEQKPIFKQGLSGILRNDPSLLTQTLVDLGFVLPHADLSKIRQGVEILLQELTDSGFRDLSTQEAMRLMEEMSEFFLSQPIQVPTDFTFLGRAAGLLLGLLDTLAPEINILDLIQAAAKGKGNSSEGESPIDYILEELEDSLKALIRLPRSINSISSSMQKGKLTAEVNLTELTTSLEKISKKLSRLTILVLFIGAIALYLLYRLTVTS